MFQRKTHIYTPPAPMLVDRYKLNHAQMIDPSVTRIYSNITPRSSRLAGLLPDNDGRALIVGQTRAVQYLRDIWDDFFGSSWLSLKSVLRYSIAANTAGNTSPETLLSMWENLHSKGRLPIRIKALPEGSRCPQKVPFATIINTSDDCAYLSNYLETQLTAEIWKSVVDGSKAYEMLRFLTTAAIVTTGNANDVTYQAHDFSARGMSGVMDFSHTGLGHLACFTGSDTTSAIPVIQHYYKVFPGSVIATAPPATEHMVMSLGGQTNELELFRKLIKDIYPTGIVSIVSDTWDFWNMITEGAAALKEDILSREADAKGVPAKTIFRPDSSDPVKVICGDPMAPIGSPRFKGAVECLWDTFGGAVSPQGYRILNPAVGLIYGDSITLERMVLIIKRLMSKGFASTNVVFGVGSFTYQYVTRDNFSIATKATWSEFSDGSTMNLIKDPKTDPGKKSATGLLRVDEDPDAGFILRQDVSPEEEQGGALKVLMEDSDIAVNDSPQGIDWMKIRRHVQLQAAAQGCNLYTVFNNTPG